MYRCMFFNYYDYLEDTDGIPLAHLLHFTIPIKTQYGFYSSIFNFIIYEMFIERTSRGKGHGRELSKFLIDKYNFFILNESTIKSYEKLLKIKKIKYKYFRLFNNYYLMKYK